MVVAFRWNLLERQVYDLQSPNVLQTHFPVLTINIPGSSLLQPDSSPSESKLLTHFTSVSYYDFVSSRAADKRG